MSTYSISELTEAEARTYFTASFPSYRNDVFPQYAREYALFKAAANDLFSYMQHRLSLPPISREEFVHLFWTAKHSPSRKTWQAATLLPPSLNSDEFYAFAAQFASCGASYWKQLIYLSRQNRYFISIGERLIAGFVLILLLPLFAFISLLIYFFMGRPSFFRQERVGKNGNLFAVLKFRTMYTPDEYRRRDGARSWNGITQADDDRIPFLGRILRRFKLDELPQLINILRGEMAIIGYRPELREKVRLYEPEYALLCQQLPGLSDPASLAFINESEIIGVLMAKGNPNPYDTVILRVKTALSLNYLMQRSNGEKNDFSIIFLTALHSLTGGRAQKNLLPDPPDMPNIPEPWIASFFGNRKL